MYDLEMKKTQSAMQTSGGKPFTSFFNERLQQQARQVDAPKF